MTLEKRRNSRNLKILLAGTMTVILAVIVAVFVGYRQLSNGPTDMDESAPQDGSTVSIGKVRQTSSKDGKTEWHLEAESARFFDTEKKVVFKGISVVFYPKEDEEIHLTSDSGTLETELKNIDVTDNVVVKNKDFSLTTDILHYEHGRKVLSSIAPVKFSGPELMLTADSMKLELDENRIHFQGNVKGVFSEKIKL